MSTWSSIPELKKIYVITKNAKVGEIITCPGCGENIIKTSYQHTFCDKICKDRYWNNVDSRKRNRKHPPSHYRKYNVGDKSYEVRLGNAIAIERGYPSHTEMIDSMSLDDGSWDAHGGVEVEPCNRCGMQHQYCNCPDIID